MDLLKNIKETREELFTILDELATATGEALSLIHRMNYKAIHLQQIMAEQGIDFPNQALTLVPDLPALFWGSDQLEFWQLRNLDNLNEFIDSLLKLVNE